MGLKRLFCTLFLATLLAGCATLPYQVERSAEVHRPEGETTLFFVPFQPLLAPSDVTSDLFNRVVDTFDSNATGKSLNVLILKRELASIDKEWLAQQYYVTGNVFAYRQDSGCCSTEIKLHTRLQLYQPGTPSPVVRIDIPYRILFDHDRSTLEIEKERMVETLARQLHEALLAEMAPL